MDENDKDPTAASLGELRLALGAVIERLDRIERELGEIMAASEACTCGGRRLVGSVQGLPDFPVSVAGGFFDVEDGTE